MVEVWKLRAQVGNRECGKESDIMSPFVCKLMIIDKYFFS